MTAQEIGRAKIAVRKLPAQILETTASDCFKIDREAHTGHRIWEITPEGRLAVEKAREELGLERPRCHVVGKSL